MFKECAMRLGEGILAKKEDLLRQAITHQFGHDKWTVDEIKGRCCFVIDQRKKETFCVDDIPMIEFYPVTTCFNDNTLHAEQKCRVLYT